MAGLQGLKFTDLNQPMLRKPESFSGRDIIYGLRDIIYPQSVMAKKPIDVLLDEDAPIDYSNLSNIISGRARQAFIDPIRKYGSAINKGFSGEQLTIKDQLDLINGMIDTTVGGLFTHGTQKGGLDLNDLYSFPAFKKIAKDNISKIESIAEKHMIAQKNAAKPITEGGLGLAANNTARERADVLFPIKGYHGTSAVEDFSQFDLLKGGSSQESIVGTLGIFSAEDPIVASEFLKGSHRDRILPLRLRKGIHGKVGSLDLPESVLNKEVEGTIRGAKELGYDFFFLNNYTIPSSGKKAKTIMVGKPNQIRSEFAAFDPEKIESDNILASFGPSGISFPVFLYEGKEKK